MTKQIKETILALETSCDETAAAIVRGGRTILANRVHSQTKTHKEFGGVVPEVAAREHLESINQIVDDALNEAGLSPNELDAVACTMGPGLIGTLLVGIACGRALSWAWDLPFIGVDHLRAHVCANFLETDIEPPFICLLVSGGHTQIVHFKSYSESVILGQTVDDAAGEAYDKVARLLGLGYPGGPMVDAQAKLGNSSAYKFPEAKMAGYDFSFSGLKTAVLRTLENTVQPWPVADLSASFQEAVVSALVRKTIAAQRSLGVPRIVLAGGVAANSRLREKLSAEADVPVCFPHPKFCTDNAAMVASAAYFSSANGHEHRDPGAAYSRSKLSKSVRLK